MMSRKLRIILLVLLAVFVIIQIIPVNRPANEPTNYNFFTANNVPEDMEIMIRNACFDCHSHEVNYPWYAYVAPVSWKVASDVKEGRQNLDFSNWNKLDKRKKLNALDEIGDEVGHGEMPLKIYTVIHSDARLTEADRDRIVLWTDELAEKVFEE